MNFWTLGIHFARAIGRDPAIYTHARIRDPHFAKENPLIWQPAYGPAREKLEHGGLSPVTSGEIHLSVVWRVVTCYS